MEPKCPWPRSWACHVSLFWARHIKPVSCLWLKKYIVVAVYLGLVLFIDSLYIFREIVHQTPASVSLVFTPLLHTTRLKILVLDYVRHHCTAICNFSLVTLTRTVGDIQFMECGFCICFMNIISMFQVYDAFVRLYTRNQQHYDLHLSNCFFHSDVFIS